MKKKKKKLPRKRRGRRERETEKHGRKEPFILTDCFNYMPNFTHFTFFTLSYLLFNVTRWKGLGGLAEFGTVWRAGNGND